MLRRQHILLSRTIALSLFAMALVLTPRAWVEPSSSTEMVPVETLDQPSKCLWCEPAATPCPSQSQPAWLNPDQPVASDCEETQQAPGTRS